MFSVDILMKAVIVTNTVLKKKRSWSQLSRIVAALNEVSVFTGISDLDSHSLVPLICNWSQFAIKSGTEVPYDPGQRIAKVLLLSASEAVTAHDNSAAESGIVRIQTRERCTLVGSQHVPEPCATLLV